MTVARVHKLSLAAAVTVALLGMVQGSPRLALAAVWATTPRLHRPRPRWAVFAVNAATVLLLVLAIGVVREDRIDGALLIVMLGIANRFLLRSSHRDDLILVGATAVLVAATTTITPGLAFVLIVIGFVPTALWALWSATLLASHPDLGRRPAPKQMRTIALWGLALMVTGFGVVALLPRYHFSRWLSPGYFMQLAGASHSMDLQVGGVRPPGGGAAVMQIEVKDGAATGRVEGLYARLFALNDFDGKTFTEGRGGRTRPVYPRGARYNGRGTDFDSNDGPGMVRVSIERMARVGQQHPVATLGRAWPSYVLVRDVLETESGNWIASAFPSRNTVVYKVDLGRRAPILPLRPEDRAAQLDRLRALPDDLDPRIVALAKSLVRDDMTFDERVSAVLAHFDRGGYTYSLDALEGTSDNPLVRFLFEAKAGHCELYAGALTVLLRLVDVPARVVTGYYGGRWNDAGGYLEMSEDDAHAWVEIFHEDDGWRWVDATPADERVRRKGEAFAWLSDLYKALDKLWYDKVVDFDEAKRRRLVGCVEEAMAEIPGFDGLMGSGPRGGGGGVAAPLAAGAVAAFVAFVFWRRRRRRPDVLGLRLRRLLAGEVADHRTLAELLRAVPRERLEAARRAVALYEAWRFGPDPSPAGAGPVLEAIVAAERVKV